MRTPRNRSLAASVALAAGLGLLAGCTGDPPAARLRNTAVPAGALRLVAFDSCSEALAQLKRAAKESIGPYGLGNGWGPFGPAEFAGAATAAVPRAAVEKATDATGASQPQTNYSGTNTHEVGVDEPDLVKTDGRRIVTISQGVLRVVDPAARAMTGKLNLRRDAQDPIRWTGADLLLSGDRALVLVRQAYAYRVGGAVVKGPVAVPDAIAPSGSRPQSVDGPRLLLVDLVGTPRIVSEYRVDGALVDARQVGETARVVIRSGPRLTFPWQPNGTDAQRTARNRAIVDRSGVDDWLPRYSVTTSGATRTGRIACDRVSRPVAFSGAAMLTVLSFDLGAPALTDGDPVTVLADGETVYSNGPSLYISNDQRWRIAPRAGEGGVVKPVAPVTDIYKFDTSGPGRPRYAAAGTVKGWLLNQYAMSEWDDHLRVATTTENPWDPTARTSSSVVVVRQSGGRLTKVGEVGGLGKGERIYAVRFVGPTGYVVTFRQTDPLYTLDLSDPEAPSVAGELKITGFSAYLHPLDGGRLIGVGQEATAQGQVEGTQVSLFDVSDLTRPERLARFQVRYGQSEAEYDPHAFLWWAPERLLVLPLTSYAFDETGVVGSQVPTAGVVLLRVGDHSLTQVGVIGHRSTTATRSVGDTAVRRSLVVGEVLWTLSEAGLKATSLSTLDTLAWVPLT
jgi:hypothetical protein